MVVRDVSPYGSILTDGNGITLYLFAADSKTKSTCNGACASYWPPFVVKKDESIEKGNGVSGDISTFKRSDGTLQVAYNGMPLYYFKPDSSPGDTKGQNFNSFGAPWYVVLPQATSFDSARTLSVNHGKSSGGGYGGY